MYPHGCRASECIYKRVALAQQNGEKGEERAHPDSNRGPAGLQSAALPTELHTHMCKASAASLQMEDVKKMRFDS